MLFYFFMVTLFVCLYTLLSPYLLCCCAINTCWIISDVNKGGVFIQAVKYMKLLQIATKIKNKIGQDHYQRQPTKQIKA
jgi:hypothetical protein